MSVSKEVINTLKNIGVPVSFQTTKTDKFPYVTFFTYLDTGRLHSDDKETITGYFVQVDVWSKADYTNLVKDIHESMLTANFIKQQYHDLYEPDTGVYHKVMRFLKEVEQ